MPSSRQRRYYRRRSEAGDEQRRSYLAIQPPSTTILSPDTYELASLAKKMATPFSSSASPQRPIGIRLVMDSCNDVSGFVRTSRLMSVAMYPGITEFTRMPLPLHSFDKALVNIRTPPLLAAYAAILTPPWKLARLPTLMITPFCPALSQLAPTSLQVAKIESRLVRSTASYDSKSKSSALKRRWIPAALSKIEIS